MTKININIDNKDICTFYNLPNNIGNNLIEIFEEYNKKKTTKELEERIEQLKKEITNDE